MKIRYNPQSMFRLSTVVNSVIQILATHIRTCPTNGDQSTCHSKCGECMATDAMQQIHSIYGMNCSLYAAQTNDFSNGCECMPLLSVFACLSLSVYLMLRCRIPTLSYITHMCICVCTHALWAPYADRHHQKSRVRFHARIEHYFFFAAKREREKEERWAHGCSKRSDAVSPRRPHVFVNRFHSTLQRFDEFWWFAAHFFVFVVTTHQFCGRFLLHDT